MNFLSLWSGRNGRALVEDVGFLIEEPEDEYRSKSVLFTDPEQLEDFRRDAFLFRKRQQGLLLERKSHNGHVHRAAAVRILCGGQRYESEFAIDGPVDPRTGEPYRLYSSKFEQWAREQTKPALHHDQVELVEQLDLSVRSHPATRDLLAEGVAHGIVRCTYREVPCQARLDWLNPQRGIVAIHVCDSLGWLESTLRTGGRVHSLAFQRALLAEMTGKLVPAYVVAVEESAPHRCGVWRVSPWLLGKAHRENDKALDRLRRCRESDYWPTGYETVRALSPIGF